MPFTEREPFVLSGVQSDDSAWNKAGTSFGTKLWQRSHVVDWRRTSSNTRRRLRRHESGYLSVMASRVENRRSNCSLPVDIRLGFRLATSVRFGLVLFPVPAHRTGPADFPHPALGKDSCLRPRKVRGPVWYLDQAKHRVQRRFRKSLVCRPRLFVFVPGHELHPLKSSAFPRRTLSPVKHACIAL